MVETSDPDTLQPNDILVVWGGGDIHPSLYDKGRSRFSGAYELPSKRDITEWNLMQRAKELDVPIIGVCRGAQMLCALAGGFLIQHVQNHGGRHMVVTNDNQSFPVNSIHHQMLYPFNIEHEMVAWCPTNLSDVHYDVDTDIPMPVEPEFVYFPQIKGFAIQWHPEMLAIEAAANQYVINFINQRVKENVSV
jgi:gamma-glutamyl-gamma-aminobutyrate hydrolase PuuD